MAMFRYPTACCAVEFDIDSSSYRLPAGSSFLLAAKKAPVVFRLSRWRAQRLDRSR